MAAFQAVRQNQAVVQTQGERRSQAVVRIQVERILSGDSQEHRMVVAEVDPSVLHLLALRSGLDTLHML